MKLELIGLILLLFISTISFGEEKVDPSLIGCWQFNEGKGDVVEDLSPFDNFGMVRGAKWVEDGIGHSLEFDGIDDYVEIPSSASLHITDEVTIFVWIKQRKFKEVAWGDIVRKGGPANYAIYSHQVSGNIISSHYYNINDKWEPEWMVTTACFIDEWHHIAFVLQENLMGKLYFDGKLVEIQKFGAKPKPNSEALLIGTEPGLGRFFCGFIDEVRVYNRAFDPKEISQYYNSSRDLISKK